MEKQKLRHLDKNKKYIIATDLDGTFLTHGAAGMHIDNYKAVKAIKESNNYFIIATGRSWTTAKMIYDQLELDTPSIHFSGIDLHNLKLNGDCQKNSIMNSKRISKEFVKKIVNEFNLLSKVDFFLAHGEKQETFFSSDDDINDLFFDPYEITIHLKPEFSTFEFVDKIKLFIEPKYHVLVWNNSFTNDSLDFVIASNSTNKAIGLKTIAKELDIKQENVIFFGDNVNDLEALKWAGYAIVPSNAIPEAKEIADETLELSNSDGAVAKRILELING